jgi:hypothetical protein
MTAQTGCLGKRADAPMEGGQVLQRLCCQPVCFTAGSIQSRRIDPVCS